MKKKKKKHTISPKSSLRDKRMSFMVSDDEYNAIKNYLSKYKINNCSNWMRTTLLSQISSVLVDHDYPTLFSEHEMRK
ncbi:hypothetical protein M2138_000445 [Dysgonomonadaceae bacterium PH5-43]|nr:hypothetical protein [Dysgonomonadaceae bacterium PH5-43]